MDEELEMLIRLKYFPISTNDEYIETLPKYVQDAIMEIWPFHIADDIYKELIIYERNAQEK